MIPYCVEKGFITDNHLDFLRKVMIVVNMLPSNLDCHEVCKRVVKLVDGLTHVRGRFNHFEHSWLVIDGTRIIIDAYPWACGSGPFIVDGQTCSPWATLYKGHDDVEVIQNLDAAAMGEAFRDDSPLRSQESVAV